MAAFNKACTTSYWSAILTIAVSCTIFEFYNVVDLEIWIRGHSIKVSENGTT